MITVATLLWEPNRNSRSFSRMYDETWVEKLYRGFKRNITGPMDFLCYTDRTREWREPITSVPIKAARPDYSSCIQPYELDRAMILVGLDTVVTGNIDHMVEYCFTGSLLALPIDPYHPQQACNGVALVPRHHGRIARWHRGENDMEWVRQFPHTYTDRLFPGQIVSYKGHVEKHGLGDARIVYFHGERKPHQLPKVEWIKEHWK